MITLQSSSQAKLEIEHLIIDYEGTLAMDGRVHPKAKDKINLLAKRLNIYILVKGEQEKAEEVLKRVKAKIIFLKEPEPSAQKLEFLLNLGAPKTGVIGNGEDDVPMSKEAGFSMAIIGKEGGSGELIQSADLTFLTIVDALDFLLKPLRQKATLG